MTDGQVLEFSHATKRFGVLTAVDDLSARIEPGAVTAFLGPNGAGKTTSLRMLLGQIRPSSGTATIGGAAHAELRHPLRTIGSVLEEAAFRPRRTAPRQLTIAAKANGIPLSRVDEVLALVGLQNETETRIGAFSLGMRQRLSVAGALLGDPGALVLDEPANGLDPEGIRWMRLLMRRLADEGRTVLVSSHVLSEIEQIADNVLVLSKGRLVYADSIGKLSDPTTGSVVVDADDRSALAAALRNAGLSFDVLRSGLTVQNTDAAAVGAVAASAGLALTTLQQRGPSLEEVFLDLVHGRRDPLAGTVPVVEAPVAMTGESDAGGDASTAEAAAEGGPETTPAADEPAADETTSDGNAPTAGLFGTVAAVPVVAAASAGVAALFAPAAAAAPAEGTIAIPTTRREAAEFAAAQSAAEGGADADEPSEEQASQPGSDDEAAEGDPSAADEIDASPASEDATETDSEDALEEASSDDGHSDHGHSDEDGSDEDGSDEGGSDEDGEESDADSDASTDEGSDTEGDGPDADDHGTTESGDGIADDEAAHDGAAADEDAAGSDSEEAESEQTALEDGDRSDTETTEPGDAETAIAAGVALTAPIDADYTPGEAHSDSDADAQHDADAEHEGDLDHGDDAEEQDSRLTHAADEGVNEKGDALGSFETAALSIPDAAPASFDELITGGPAPEQGEETAADDAAADAEGSSDRDGTPTAATTVITTPPVDDDGFTAPEPSTETTEIAGIEIFAALADGRTQEIQVILDDAPDEDDDLEDVTQGEIDQDEDPRAAAVSASLAAAARAFFTEDAPSYTPGPVAEESPEQSDAHDESPASEEQHGDRGDEQHRRDEQHHDGEHRGS